MQQASENRRKGLTFFDLWLNGKQVASDVKHLLLTDITELVSEGKNNLHIRGYQSDSYKRITAAITGGRETLLL